MNNLSKADISEQLQSLVTAAHQLACSLDIGDERIEAFELYEALRRLQRLATAVEIIKQAAPHMLADESLKDPGGALCGKVRAVPDGWVMVPKVPGQAHLNSIAMRYRHDFYLLNDAQKDSALAIARQMYEECSGQGFFAIAAAPKPDGSNG
ncbi:hypothetical protein KC222_00020 [Cedecea davisae]|uniref:Uncharacterized protein n=1 Tax=Cedecea davisae TaxID=158484 RepID=A0ABS6DB10_9ENTR|nr:hypothetical protein [Cedecea davisae]MBU4680398.1 hypothetical protein [Cedecea davisae]MBU4685048.1 hypothetical protein [Cedecea davisae]